MNFDVAGQMVYNPSLMMAIHPSRVLFSVRAATLCLAACLPVCSVLAQSSAPASSQTVFTPNSDPSSPEHHFDASKQSLAPRSLFGDPGDDVAPMPPPRPQSVPRAPQKDWTQMTPNEILGLPELQKEENEQALAAHRPPALQSPLENFLLNQRLAQTGSTNQIHPPQAWGFMDPETGLGGTRRAESLRNGTAGLQPQLFNQMEADLNAAAGRDPLSPDPGWAHAFTIPQQTQLNPAAQAEMAAFQQLLQPGAFATPVAGHSAVGFLPSAPFTDPNLNPGPAGYNPAGASFAPLANNIGRPKRLTGMPALTTPYTAPAARPSWAPQPPPWTLTTPQLFTIPVRKF